ncbi:LPXTG cell wall anchor domain-containing protein [Actinoplanes sp. TRM 88003]|uniref:LPXTG cell wall anchor domain-containing protein n=1 Tax=Paractinoplanes aksuensis TaxID=2939490 RepID=A0ABT1DFJ5_9ACTN|nr:LPXTG cell wall anchor domain-containing protein [Actinoplanes aksuensis]MCO8269598.1 LPXTG cell wall anchor domain-containing protein [Actinoplanes aksuensis]
MLRLITAAAAVVATVALAPAPAQARAAAPVAGYSLSAPDIGFSSTGAFLPVVLSANHVAPQKITNVRMILDATGIAGLGTVAVPEVCGTTGRPVACEVGTIDAAHGYALPQILLQATPGATVGRSGRLKITVTGDGLGTLVVTPTVTVDEVRLIVRGNTRSTEKPGATINAGMRISNAGPGAARGALVRFDADPAALSWLLDYENCWPRPGGTVVCDLPDANLVSIPYNELAGPALKVADDARNGRYLARTTWWAGPSADAVARVLIPDAQPRPGRPTLKLTTPTQDDCCGTPTSPPTAGMPWTSSADRWVEVEGGAEGPGTPTVSPPTTEPTPPGLPGEDVGGETPGAQPPGQGGGDGGLPITGTDTVLAGVAGGVLLAAGVLAFALARRRRTRFTA